MADIPSTKAVEAHGVRRDWLDAAETLTVMAIIG
jgi:hypothetical protein